MHEQVETEKNILRLIEGAKILNIPIIWTEQYPKGLGPTISSIRRSLEKLKVLEKIAFSCCGDPEIKRKIVSQGRRQIMVCGIEAHICVYQTAADLLDENFDVHIIVDAVMSRKESNYHLALQKLRSLGAQMSSVEMALFELVKVAKGDAFKTIARIIK